MFLFLSSEAVISSLKAVGTGHLRSVHKSVTALVFKNSVFLLDYLCSLFLILAIVYRYQRLTSARVSLDNSP